MLTFYTLLYMIVVFMFLLLVFHLISTDIRDKQKLEWLEYCEKNDIPSNIKYSHLKNIY